MNAFIQKYSGGDKHNLLTFTVNENNLNQEVVFNQVSLSFEPETQLNVESMLTSLGLMIVSNTNTVNSAVAGFAQV